MFKEKTTKFDLESIMEEFQQTMISKYKDIPKKLNDVFEGFSRAASDNLHKIALKLSPSNETGSSKPVSRTATFHGYVKQGHPSGDPMNTGWKSSDKRYFTKENYASIVKETKELLKEDWFKSGWEGGAKDAPIRAALDLAILFK